ncbi:hypothetical protein MIND_00874100 [Mycena indigotica]|uniref:DUF6534 domain-containing protein n=1 Tax=Mycena indigotica TaxID=2126181 RepID=A0A8H6SH34_9AGAR|nr:uncharacterized protein MIND_00874100 [Mycena indigotica]KAF7299254.1 hypothetical protein MIND_00874100 [Mycena indigotica]
MPQTAPSYFTGPIFVGFELNWLLLGLLLVQVYYFYSAFPDERWGIKALVFTLLVIELVQTALGSIAVYDMLVRNWGNPKAFTEVMWAAYVQPFTVGLSSTIVQMFFVWRIHKLKGEEVIVRLICVLIAIISLGQGLTAMVSTIRFATQAAGVSALQGASGLLGTKIWLGGAVACDVLIAVTMISILSRARQSLPWAKADSVITKLIIHCVESGAITTAVATVQLALFLSRPENFMHEAPLYVLGKLYSNVVLATLNWRAERKRHIFSDSSNPSTSLSTPRQQQSFGLRHLPGDRTKAVVVETVLDPRQSDFEQKRFDFEHV